MVSLFRRPQLLKTGLTKTRQSFLSRLSSLVAKNNVDEEFWSGLEEMLIGADVGVETTVALVDKLRERAEKEHVRAATRVEEMLKEELLAILTGAVVVQPPISSTQFPTVILVVGVNGSGKTTSIAKLAQYYKMQGKKVVLAAADTFRAAAI
ncbi:MAG TPA: signal recognition particle receptor subunit alpha, partial [Anaerolineae bacterium]